MNSHLSTTLAQCELVDNDKSKTLELFTISAFEKVIEGSCSKLRTRIRLIDSKNKLKKEELHKNEYSVEQGQKTVVEVTGLT